MLNPFPASLTCIGSLHGSPQKAPSVTALLNKGAFCLADSVIRHSHSSCGTAEPAGTKQAWEQLLESRTQAGMLFSEAKP